MLDGEANGEQAHEKDGGNHEETNENNSSESASDGQSQADQEEKDQSSDGDDEAKTQSSDGEAQEEVQSSNGEDEKSGESAVSAGPLDADSKIRMVAEGDSTPGVDVGKGVTGSRSAEVNVRIKSNQEVAYCIPNEKISAEIGRFLRLPVPPPALTRSPDYEAVDIWFASLEFDSRQDELPQLDSSTADKLVKEKPSIATGIVLFDVLIFNDDRHTNNIAADFQVTPPEVYLFDHSHTLFGSVDADDGIQKLKDRKQKFINDGHCLLQRLSTDKYFDTWLKRIKKLPDFYIRGICFEVTDAGLSEDEADAAYEFLKYRRDNIRTLVQDNQSLFKSINQWSLPLQ